jgi:hypothetical protein
MDDVKNRDVGKNGGKNDDDSNLGSHNEQSSRSGGDEGSDVLTDTMEQAKTAARNVGEQAWSAAASAGTAAQDLARRTRDQAGGALYEQGSRASEYLTRNVNEYPLAALLIAGAVGYGMAYLMHSSWQGGSSDTQSDDRRSGPRRQPD